jgi:hypothetical protein
VSCETSAASNPTAFCAKHSSSPSITRAKAREILNEYPAGGYMTIVENWRQLSDGQIEFTMRRLTTAD